MVNGRTWIHKRNIKNVVNWIPCNHHFLSVKSKTGALNFCFTLGLGPAVFVDTSSCDGYECYTCVHRRSKQIKQGLFNMHQILVFTFSKQGHIPILLLY